MASNCRNRKISAVDSARSRSRSSGCVDSENSKTAAVVSRETRRWWNRSSREGRSVSPASVRARTSTLWPWHVTFRAALRTARQLRFFFVSMSALSRSRESCGCARASKIAAGGSRLTEALRHVRLAQGEHQAISPVEEGGSVDEVQDGLFIESGCTQVRA